MKLSTGEILHTLDHEAELYDGAEHGRAIAEAAQLIRSMEARLKVADELANVIEKIEKYTPSSIVWKAEAYRKVGRNE